MQGTSEMAFWVYAAKTAIGALLLWLIWPLVQEMRWRWSWEGCAVGVLVFWCWVGLDPFYPRLVIGDQGAIGWNPFRAFGEASWIAWSFVCVRLIGSVLIVPPLEETFYRSWLYRYIANEDFSSVPLKFLGWKAFLISSIVFGLAHYEWLAGILCGMAYLALVIKHGHLGAALTAHATTNLLLGIWVVRTDSYRFW